jgi:hypothetical protein
MTNTSRRKPSRHRAPHAAPWQVVTLAATAQYRSPQDLFPDLTEQGIRTGWGTGSDIVLEMVQYGIVADATNQPGFEFTNVQVQAAPGLGPATVQLRSGGTNPLDGIINGGSARGSWTLGAFPAPAAGYLTVLNMI